jgi:hypothetical protein
MNSKDYMQKQSDGVFQMLKQFLEMYTKYFGCLTAYCSLGGVGKADQP